MKLFGAAATPGQGHPPLCEWGDEDVQTIREVYLRTNLATDAGSMSYAIRRTVYDDLKLPERERKLSPGALAALHSSQPPSRVADSPAGVSPSPKPEERRFGRTLRSRVLAPVERRLAPSLRG
jgi:hypothetical protein